MSQRRDDFDVVLDVDSLLIRAEDIAVEHRRRRRHRYNDVAGAGQNDNSKKNKRYND